MFEKKKKEPKLSSEMENILNKSHLILAHHSSMMAEETAKFPPTTFATNPISIPPMMLSGTTKITIFICASTR